MENSNQPNQPAVAPAHEMLGQIAAFIRNYLVCSDEQAIVLAVWILHTWMYRALPNTPYLSVQSPGPACGKTRCLQLLQLFSPPGSWYTSAPPPHLFMKKLLTAKPAASPDKPAAHELPSVVFLDDREFTLGNSNRNPIIPFLLNGFRPDTSYLYQHERSSLREFSVFCPKVFAGVETLPSALAERCIPIDLKRKLSSEKVADWSWSYARTTAAPLLDWLKRWSELNMKTLAARAQLMAMTPSDRFNVREREFVRPLLILAHLVEGKWLDNLNASLQWLKLRSGRDTATHGLQLLTDLRYVFNERQNPVFISSRELVADLREYESRPWRDWGKAPEFAMARLLRPFGVRPTPQRISEKQTIKVYCKDNLEEAWSRYL